MRKVVVLILAMLLLLTWIPSAGAAGPMAVYGVVADELGRPVPGAEVEVYRLSEGLVAVLATDKTGGFRLEAQPSVGSLWQLRASAKGYRTLETGWIDLARNRYQSLKLQPMLGGLRLTVRNRDGAPTFADVLVVGAGGLVAAHVMKEDGQIDLPELLPGEYRVAITAPGMAPATRPVAVAAGQTASALVLLEPAALAVGGQVRDSVTGKAVAGARVDLLRADGTWVTDTVTDQTGWFRLGTDQEAPGSYKIHVAASGYRPATAAVALNAGRVEERSLIVIPATDRVAGIVFDESGKKWAGAPVGLEVRGYGRIAETSTSADGSFRFEGVPADAALEYRAVLLAPELLAASAWLKMAPGVTDHMLLHARAGMAPDVVNGSMSGQVTTATGVPLAGATVDLIHRNHVVRTLTTDDMGWFTAEEVRATQTPANWYRAAWSGHPYTVRIKKAGYYMQTEVSVGGQPAVDLHVDQDGRTQFRAELRPLNTELKGRVLDHRGEPVPGAQVHLLDGRSPVVPYVTTDTQGWYSLKDVPVGPGAHYEMRVRAQGYLQTDAVTIVPEAIESQMLAAQRLNPSAAVLTGRVLGSDGQPVEGVKVTLRGPDGDVLEQAMPDEFGVYRVTVPLGGTGPVVLTAGRDGWVSGAVELTEPPQPGAVLTRDMVIVPAVTRVTGRVLNGDGGPVAGVKVELLQEGFGVVAIARTNADGAYAFDDVKVDGTGWFWLRISEGPSRLGGSLRHGTDMVPLLRLPPGQLVVTDLLVH
ncbi:MAG TPA: carboxypeptidase regulatory-like domain-containing protein [Symbiobacteriaceae bacterium]|nr:carboxypeptidase regulatory-like domain-containing protein [Symbiobacteriaceae bacterium]